MKTKTSFQRKLKQMKKAKTLFGSIRNKPVPRTIKAILTVEDLSSNSKVEAKAKIPTNNITEEIKTPETLVRFAISGCEDAKIVASIV